MRRTILIAAMAALLLGACKGDRTETKPAPSVAPAGSVEERLLAGRKAYNRGEFMAAADIFRGVAAQAPEKAEPLVDLARALSRIGRGAEAFKTVHRAITIAPDDSYARLNLAYILAAQGLFNDGAESLHVALERKPKDHRLHCALVDLLAKSKGAEEDLAAAKKAAEAAGAKCKAGDSPLGAYGDVIE